MSKLLLVRHGETELNSGKRFWGNTDVKLSEEGIRQAEQIRDFLTGTEINAVYASNLSRALATAEIIASRHRMKITTCTELAEINFGALEGLTFEEISSQHPEMAELLSTWSIRPRFPGGEGVDDLNERVNNFLPRLKKHTEEETILIVSHAGVLRLLVCNLLDLGLQHWRQIRIDLASLSVVETYTQGAVLSSLNNISHLR
ncbi:alpha-ribazole phosphatase [Chloroflexota bacterium]